MNSSWTVPIKKRIHRARQHRGQIFEIARDMGGKNQLDLTEEVIKKPEVSLSPFLFLIG